VRVSIARHSESRSFVSLCVAQRGIDTHESGNELRVRSTKAIFHPDFPAATLAA